MSSKIIRLTLGLGVIFALSLFSGGCKARKRTEVHTQERISTQAVRTELRTETSRDTMRIEAESLRQELDTAGRVRTIVKTRTILRAGRVDTIHTHTEARDTIYIERAVEVVKESEHKAGASVSWWLISAGAGLVAGAGLILYLRR